MTRVRRTFALVATLTAVIVSTIALQAAPASAASSSDFVSRINSLRASQGLGSLSVDGSLSSVAQAWAEKMAGVNKISHNPSLSGQVGGNWTKLGENVGTGGDVTSIFSALVASPGHYRNMVDSSFNRIGVGIAMGSDGRIYTAHEFASFPGGSSAASTGGGSNAKASSTPAAKSSTKSSGSSAKGSTGSSTKSSGGSKTSTTKAPAAPPVTEAPAPPAPPAPVLPAPDTRIVQSLLEVGSMATQG